MQEVKKDLIPASARELINGATSYLNSVIDVQITNDEQYENAGPFVGKLKKYIKELESGKKEITKEWRINTKAVNDEFKPVTTSLENGVSKISQALGKYHMEKEARIKAEQAKLEAEAAEKRRKEEEKARKKMEEAERLAQEGNVKAAEKAAIKAEEYQDKADMTVSQTVVHTKPVGTSFSYNWTASIEDMESAVLGLLSQPDTAHLVSIDIKKVEKLQNASKGMRNFDGIVFRKHARIINRG